jgi:hypothetical protein
MAYKCDKCGEELALYASIDTYACLKCDRWTEDKCSDKSCYFCSLRTDKPSQSRLEHS